MKKLNVLLGLLFILSYATINAQSDIWSSHKTYLRFGLSSLGSALDNSLSPKDNVFKGNYGATSGLSLDLFGHIFYFGKHDSKINYGLDWTILSLTYNKMNKWNDYAIAAGQDPTNAIDGTKIAASAATKVGPIISFNPVEKLVIDAHFQIAPTFRYYDLDYVENNGEGNYRSFAFADYGKEDADQNYDADAFKNRVGFGLSTDLGITIRRGIIGISLDYLSGKTNTNYDVNEKQDNEIHGKAKIPAHNLELKLGLNF